LPELIDDLPTASCSIYSQKASTAIIRETKREKGRNKWRHFSSEVLFLGLRLASVCFNFASVSLWAMSSGPAFGPRSTA